MRPVESVSYNRIRGKAKGSDWPSSKDVDDDSVLGLLRSTLFCNFDLPTEAQWEYSCRAGTTTAWNNGTDITNTDQDTELDKLGRYRYNHDDGKGGYSDAHTTVGSYLPNAWGLYDMHGNVREWCLDWYGSYEGDATDPKGPAEGTYRLLRGGFHWCIGASVCRSAMRFHENPSNGHAEGFRLVIIPKE